uniref:Uncharacterized protein n=1 Tax=Knipowitschia caucasica TaxID=637954 RepID=A0AAV2MFW4_KNICA
MSVCAGSARSRSPDPESFHSLLVVATREVTRKGRRSWREGGEVVVPLVAGGMYWSPRGFEPCGVARSQAACLVAVGGRWLRALTGSVFARLQH